MPPAPPSSGPSSAPLGRARSLTARRLARSLTLHALPRASADARGETARHHRRPARHADVLLLPRARLPEACVRVLPRARAACHSLVAPGLLAVMELLSLSPVALWLCLRSLAFSAVLLPLACCPPHEHMPLADEPFAFGCCVPQPSPSCLSHSCMSLSSPSRRLTCSVLMSLSPSAGAGHDGTQLACRISRPGASAARVVACVVLPSRIHGAESCPCICVRERACAGLHASLWCARALLRCRALLDDGCTDAPLQEQVSREHEFPASPVSMLVSPFHVFVPAHFRTHTAFMISGP